jgi:hypothetical protein
LAASLQQAAMPRHIPVAAVASGAYATPVYSCRYVERYDRWGNIRLIKVCDAY